METKPTLDLAKGAGIDIKTVDPHDAVQVQENRETIDAKAITIEPVQSVEEQLAWLEFDLEMVHTGLFDKPKLLKLLKDREEDFDHHVIVRTIQNILDVWQGLETRMTALSEDQQDRILKLKAKVHQFQDLPNVKTRFEPRLAIVKNEDEKEKEKKPKTHKFKILYHEAELAPELLDTFKTDAQPIIARLQSVLRNASDFSRQGYGKFPAGIASGKTAIELLDQLILLSETVEQKELVKTLLELMTKATDEMEEGYSKWEAERRQTRRRTRLVRFGRILVWFLLTVVCLASLSSSLILCTLLTYYVAAILIFIVSGILFIGWYRYTRDMVHDWE